eukprot:TRINITY_DN49980_c0_g1_i1.p1 TRINITY_DN49980_c0_g1~~TRINITY_DN49980_c0_g1_i1.p1  ORF type:complete len:336 (-),score=36.44 TRINITY_DN49980_c0_g1_i1:101-1108(-)
MSSLGETTEFRGPTSEGDPLVSSQIHSVAVFGDSWAAPDYSWPVVLGKLNRWNVWQFAQGGSTSDTLQAQAELAHNSPLKQQAAGVLAIIHGGGNDIQLSLGAGPFAFIRNSVCNCALWSPCFLAAFALISLYGLWSGRWAVAAILGAVYVANQMNIMYRIAYERDHQYVVERVACNILETMESIRSLGVKHIIVAGLPVSPAVPLLAQIAVAVPCPTRCMLSLARMFSGLSNSRLQVRIRAFESKHPDCTVMYFDEAAELDSLLVQAPPQSSHSEHVEDLPSSGKPALQDFWVDPIHPTPRGHLWLAYRIQSLWEAKMPSLVELEQEENPSHIL